MANEKEEAQEPRLPSPAEVQLNEQVQLGERSMAATTYLGDYIFAEVWATVTKIANVTDGDEKKLISLAAELRAVMKLTQKLQIDVMSSEIAREQLKKAYTKVTPTTRR